MSKSQTEQKGAIWIDVFLQVAHASACVHSGHVADFENSASPWIDRRMMGIT